MYYEYWGLKKPPFDNVPDPSMYVDCHASMENAIAETLFAIEEGDECIAVIVGDVGLGKTLSIRMIIDSLDQDKYKIALITNPGITFVQILQEIIGQLTGKQCEEKRKVNLLEIFNQILFASLEEGKKILIFIDEANAITPVNLESLRLLTNMQGDRRNLFTMVLAGQIEFARRLEHPKRANLFQRVGTYNRIDKLDSAGLVRSYVEKRLALAGAVKPVFTDDAFDKIWEHSDRGVPRLINKISKLCLKAGETNEFSLVEAGIVEQIGSRFHTLTGPAIQKRRSRKRLPDEIASEAEEPQEEGEDLLPGREAEAEFEAREARPAAEVSPAPEMSLPEEAKPLWEEKRVASAEPTPLRQEDALALEKAPLPAEEAPMPSEEEAPALDRKAEEIASPAEAAETMEARETEPPVEAKAVVQAEPAAEIQIGGHLIRIDLPDTLVRQAASSTKEHRLKLAGVLAAETLKKHPELTASFSVDPVPIWQEIRNFVMNHFDRETASI